MDQEIIKAIIMFISGGVLITIVVGLTASFINHKYNSRFGTKYITTKK